MREIVKELNVLLDKTSKHSNYQLIPECISHLVNCKNLTIKSRWERERLNYVLQFIDPKNKIIVDVGGNTGFFSFELLDKGASKVHFYEGNKDHATFVYEASKLIGLEKKLIVNDKYYDFEKTKIDKKVDVFFLLNVLHHIGADFGSKEISIDQAKKQIIKNINIISEKTDLLVLQIGFNWKGNVNFPLFGNGTKEEIINFLERNISENWKIFEIGVAEQIDNKIHYNSPTSDNLKRNDELGEFLNRPLFVLKSK